MISWKCTLLSREESSQPGRTETVFDFGLGTHSITFEMRPPWHYAECIRGSVFIILLKSSHFLFIAIDDLDRSVDHARATGISFLLHGKSFLLSSMFRIIHSVWRCVLTRKHCFPASRFTQPPTRLIESRCLNLPSNHFPPRRLPRSLPWTSHENDKSLDGVVTCPSNSLSFNWQTLHSLWWLEIQLRFWGRQVSRY